jgi:hypothetical protein
MKRSLAALLLALLTVTSIGSAEAKTKRKPSKRTQEIEVEAVPAGGAVKTGSIKPSKKGFDALDSDDVVSPPSSGNGKLFGGPVEQRLTRAESRRFDLRSLPLVPVAKFERPEHEEPAITRSDVTANTGNAPPELSRPSVAPRNAPAPVTNMNFDGLDFANWGAGHPPDTVGDVGTTYYIQSINSSIGVFRKSDGVRVAAFTLNTFMSQGSFGNLCDTNNFGDPVVLYDTFEDRWIITDFAFQLSGGNVANPPGAFQCFAASMTGDPVSGGWNFYSINTQFGLGDYPKFGIWPDGLYMTASIFGFPSGAPFQNARAYAFNKQQMYAGLANPQVVSFDIFGGDFTVLPSNARLQSGTPPPGTPNYYLGTWIWLDGPTIYKFHVDWSNISTSTFTGPDLPKSTTLWPNAAVPNAASLGGNALDVLQIRAMMQNQYTNIGGVESLWATHTVRRADTSGLAAPRWYQVNVTGGNVNLSIPQATTWDPDGANVISRFMPSLAVDRVGDMALGYSTSSSTTKPAIKYAGRLASDPINTFSQTEQIMMQGLGTQTGNCGASACIRWGDYSAMSLDPDGCTFWYTNMYYAADGLNHQTRIASFGPFSGCTPVGAGGTLSGTVTATTGGAAIQGATVQFGTRTATTNASGGYSFFVPAGSYPQITASKGGFIPVSTSPVAVTDGTTTTQNFSLANAPTSACIVDTTQADWQRDTPSGVDLVASADSVVLSNGDPKNSIITTSGGGFNTTTWAGQTFTPIGSGQVTKIDVNLFCSGCSGAQPNLTLSLRATSGGFPTGADLASATVTGFSSGSGANYSAIFASPVSLTGGTMYAWVLRPLAATVPAGSIYAFSRSGADVYPGGTRVTGASSGTVWSNPLTATQTTDAGFRVWMGEFVSAGNLVSSVKDSSPSGGITPIWGNFTWNATTPPTTSVKFQVAASSSPTGPFSFVGPDGTAATFFTAASFSLSQFYNLRYLEYKAFLSTPDNTITPSLNDVSICFVDTDCSAPITITPTPAAVCSNSAGNTASGPAGETSYAWSITNGSITSATNIQTITYTAGASGTVALTLNVVEAGGCHKTASTNVTINPIPTTPTVTPNGTATFCTTGVLTSSSASGNQWYNGVTLLPGETNQTYTATTNGNYNVVVTLSGCSSAPSASTAVTVNPTPATPTITPGGPTTFCAGGSVTLTSSSASGNQWYDGVTLLAGQTNQTYVATTSGNYNVVVSALGCPSAPSASTSVTVNPLPGTPTISGTLVFCTGGNTTLSSDYTTGNQWYVGNVLISGATNQTYIATAAGSYTVTFTDGNGCTSAQSAPAVVVVNSPPPVPTISATTNGTGTQDQACPEQPLTLTATSAGATSFQWYQANNTLNGETNATYQATGVGPYFVTATANGCTTVQSAGYAVQNPTPHAAFLTAAGPTTFCAGGSVQLQSNSATGIQWYLDGNPLPNPNNQNRTVSVGGTYTVILNALGCHAQISNSIVVIVNPLPAAPTATPGGPTTFCAGGSVTLTSSVASGNQWLLNGNPIGGATNQTYPATASGSYTVTTTDGNSCTSAASNAVAVTVNPLPATPTITPGGPTTFCTGGNVTLTSSAASGNQWYLNGNPIGGATATTYVATASGNYTVKTTDGNSCTSAASAATNVTVNPIPATPTITPGGPTTFCAGGSVLLTSSSASGNQWFLNGNPIGGQTNQTYSATATGSYTVAVTTSGCTSPASAATSVTVNPIPATPTITPGGPTTFCTGGSVTLTSSSASGNQWYLNGNPIGGATSQTYPANASGSYTVKVTTSGCTSAASAATVVTINPNPNATITAPASVTTSSTGNVASAANAGVGATYAWTVTGGTLTGGNNTPSITFTAGATPGTLTINLTVTTSAGCSDAKSSNVNRVLPIVTVTSVSPNFGTVTGGTIVTVNGTNFASGATVTFGGTAATNVVVVSAIKITAKTPVHAAGAVNVTVTNTDTSTGTLTNGYTYNAQVFDPNNDGTIDPADIFYLINYLFLGGPAPHGPGGVLSGDANGDGVVDPADIFYLINYLFLGGQKPNRPGVNSISNPSALSVGNAAQDVAGSITLGTPVLRGGHYFVPVVMTSRGSVAPQTMSLKLHVGDAAISDITVRRAGAAKDVPAIFETSQRSGMDVSYVVAYDPRGLTFDGSRSAVVAEVEIAGAGAELSLSIDPALTMLGNQAGTVEATVANGKLEVKGTSAAGDSSPRPRTPGHKVN